MNIDTAALEEIISNAPNNFVIKDALVKCYEEVQLHNRILCLISGGQDSDVMLDMMIRCGAKEKTDFLFCNTGLEYSATIEHLAELENKYGITIRRVNAEVPIPICVKKYGVPFWSKYVSDMMYRLQRHNFSWEDKPYEKLVQEYPKCQTALKWWCNYGETDKFSIRRSPFLKEFIINNPPPL